MSDKKTAAQVEKNNASPPQYRIYRVTGDGHLWAHGGANGGLAHHPECGCRGER